VKPYWRTRIIAWLRGFADWLEYSQRTEPMTSEEVDELALQAKSGVHSRPPPP